ncbi:hypothetical protein COB57_00260 [Candidatus Peregrinibacteria bacterium]|nr:MAG: hypothetical protein COB57_00260 [Candidatus Peregrinibacteria bacterium]
MYNIKMIVSLFSLAFLGVFYFGYSSMIAQRQSYQKVIVFEKDSNVKIEALNANLLEASEVLEKEIQPEVTLVEIEERIEEDIKEAEGKPLKLVKTLPSPVMKTWAKERAIELFFNQPVDLESLRDHLFIIESDPFQGELSYGNDEKHVKIAPDLLTMVPENDFILILQSGVQNFKKTKTLEESRVVRFLVK